MRFRRSNGETHKHTVSETRNLRCHFWLFGLFGFWILCLSSCNFSLIPRWGSSPRGSSWAFQKHKRMPNAPREAAWATSDLCILYNLYNIYNLYNLYIYISIYIYTVYTIVLLLQLPFWFSSVMILIQPALPRWSRSMARWSVAKAWQRDCNGMPWHAMAQRCQNNSGHIWRCFKSLWRKATGKTLRFRLA